MNNQLSLFNSLVKDKQSTSQPKQLKLAQENKVKSQTIEKETNTVKSTNYYKPYVPHIEKKLLDLINKPNSIKYPNLDKELPHGCLRDKVICCDILLSKRWQYYYYLLHIEKRIGQYQLVKLYEYIRSNNQEKIQPLYENIILEAEDFPQIEFNRSEIVDNMLNQCIKTITANTGKDHRQAVEFLIDFILYGMGSNSVTELPKNKRSKKAIMNLYQLFDATKMIAYPYDYFGKLLSESTTNKYNSNAFYPTPIELGEILTTLTLGIENDNPMPTFKKFCEPCVGTGAIALTGSNYHLSGYFSEVNLLTLKACLVQFYMYAPWFAEGIWWLGGHFKCMNTLTNEVTFIVYDYL